MCILSIRKNPSSPPLLRAVENVVAEGVQVATSMNLVQQGYLSSRGRARSCFLIGVFTASRVDFGIIYNKISYILGEQNVGQSKMDECILIESSSSSELFPSSVTSASTSIKRLTRLASSRDIA